MAAWLSEAATPSDASKWYSELESCISASSSRVSNRWATLATVRGPAHDEMAGRPANRTINVRSAEITGLKFVSDTRSGKARDVREGTCDQAELCWFFVRCSVVDELMHLTSCSPYRIAGVH